MARASYIYLVHPKGYNDPILAVFTVKYESQEWAEHSIHPLENLERTRMKDGGEHNRVGISSRTLVPWE
jgi:hypothetical protein